VTLVVSLGLAAAVMLAIGYVLQQHEAAQAPGPLLRPRLLLLLARRPVWLGGIGAMVVGQLLGAAALGAGSLVVVEPLLATNVLFALPLAAGWSRRRPRTGEWGGALLLVGGLALFLADGSPSTAVDPRRVHPAAWVLTGLAVAGVVLMLVVSAKRRGPAGEATLLAAAAGVAFGLQDVLTQRSLLVARDGVGLLLGSWLPWVLVVVAVIGLTLSQSAFELAPLSASLPALTVGEPVCGIVLAVCLLGEPLRLAPGALAAELAGLLLMLIGVWTVARGPLVADPHATSV